MSRDFVVVIRPLWCGHVFRSTVPPDLGEDVWCYACAEFSEVGGDERLVLKARTHDRAAAARYAEWQERQGARHVRQADTRPRKRAPRKRQAPAPRPPQVTALGCGHTYVSNTPLRRGDLVFCRECSATENVR